MMAPSLRRGRRQSLLDTILLVVVVVLSTCSRAGASTPTAAARTIQAHLDLPTEGADDNGFFLQTWRWQTMALIRESRQLALAADASSHPGSTGATPASLGWQTAANHVVNVNMKGLHKMETEVVVSYLSETIQEPQDVVQAVELLMQDLGHNRERLTELGQELMQQTETSDRNLVAIAETCTEIASHAHHALDVTDRYLAPLVQRLSSKADQKVVNNKLISALGGFWNAGIHLVGMQKATQDHSPDEAALFRERIPKMVQRTIPTNRKSYDKSWAVLVEDANKLQEQIPHPASLLLPIKYFVGVLALAVLAGAIYLIKLQATQQEEPFKKVSK